jgi:hypothetical protein
MSDLVEPSLSPADGPGPRGVWLHEQPTAPPPPSWLWHGYLAAGNLTLLTSQWKIGKTTLLALLLARRVTGGLLAGQPVTAGRTAVVSEESVSLWEVRRRKLDFGQHICLFSRPFRTRPSAAQWLALIDSLADLRSRCGIDLAVIDPLAAFLPGRDENHAGTMLRALLPLQRLTALGLAILLLHHPSKKSPGEGLAARGSGALPAFADISLEMGPYPGSRSDDRRRVLLAFSRHDETPREQVIELNASGTDYLSLGDLSDQEFLERWERVRGVLEAAHWKLTCREILAAWPPGQKAPADVTVRRWLDRAVGQGWLLREGLGVKDAPFRYWLPGMEDLWPYDVEHILHEAQQRCPEPFSQDS